MKHPNIVAFHESFFDDKDDKLCIIQVGMVVVTVHKLCGMSSLQHWMNSNFSAIYFIAHMGSPAWVTKKFPC